MAAVHVLLLPNICSSIHLLPLNRDPKMKLCGLHMPVYSCAQSAVLRRVGAVVLVPWKPHRFPYCGKTHCITALPPHQPCRVLRCGETRLTPYWHHREFFFFYLQHTVANKVQTQSNCLMRLRLQSCYMCRNDANSQTQVQARYKNMMVAQTGKKQVLHDIKIFD